MAYDDIAFCRRPDGKLWLLGSGTHGKVRPPNMPLVMRVCALIQEILPFHQQGLACGDCKIAADSACAGRHV